MLQEIQYKQLRIPVNFCLKFNHVQCIRLIFYNSLLHTQQLLKLCLITYKL